MIKRVLTLNTGSVKEEVQKNKEDVKKEIKMFDSKIDEFAYNINGLKKQQKFNSKLNSNFKEVLGATIAYTNKSKSKYSWNFEEVPELYAE